MKFGAVSTEKVVPLDTLFNDSTNPRRVGEERSSRYWEYIGVSARCFVRLGGTVLRGISSRFVIAFGRSTRPRRGEQWRRDFDLVKTSRKAIKLAHYYTNYLLLKYATASFENIPLRPRTLHMEV